MKFREHRGGYGDSMATTIELADRAALIEHCRSILAPWSNYKESPDTAFHVKPYGGIDQRNGWDTHIVTLDGYGVLGFTDQLV